MRFRNLSITVNGVNGPLTEYHSRSHTRYGSPRYSCIVPSMADASFNVTIFPLFASSTIPEDGYAGMSPRQLEKSLCVMAPSMRNPWDDDWQLVAHIHIDGKPTPDKCILIQPPQQRDFRTCAVLARGRHVRTTEGLVEQNWIFREIGIESFFARLNTSDSSEHSSLACSGDAPAAARGRDHINRRCNSARETVGEIKVILHRVRQKGRDSSPIIYPENKMSSFSGLKIDPDIVHSAGYDKGVKREIQYVQTSYLDPKAKPFATFIFQYRGEQQLRKLRVIKDDMPDMERFGELLGQSLTISSPEYKKNPLKEVLQTQEGDNQLSSSKASDSGVDADSDSDEEVKDVVCTDSNKRKVLDVDEIAGINEKFGKPSLLSGVDVKETEQPVRKSVRRTSSDSPMKKS